jgi:hypothetical protein
MVFLIKIRPRSPNFTRWRLLMRQTLEGLCGVWKFPNLILKTLFRPLLRRFSMVSSIKSIILGSPLPKTVQLHLTTQCRVVFSAHRSISKLLCNHIKFAKNLGSPTTCVCGSSSMDPTHHGMVDNSTPNLDPISQQVLGHNAESTPTPSTMDIGLSIVHGLILFCFFLLRFIYPCLPRLPGAALNSQNQEAILTFLASLLSLFGTTTDFGRKFFESCWSKTNHHRSFGGVTYDMVQHTRRTS